MSVVRGTGRRTSGGVALSVAIELVLCGWWVVTLLSQHAQRTFDRLRPLDRIGLVIPNWRFFAPEPAVHDFHLLYRIRDLDETGTIIVPATPSGAGWRTTGSGSPLLLSLLSSPPHAANNMHAPTSAPISLFIVRRP